MFPMQGSATCGQFWNLPPPPTNLPPSSPMKTSKQGHSETSSPFWHCPPTSRSSNYSLYTRHQHYNSSNHCVITPQRHFKERQLTFQGENKNSWIMHQEGLIQPWKAAGAQFMLSGVKQTKKNLINIYVCVIWKEILHYRIRAGRAIGE